MDNRCPHMGFPLARGTTKDGILTCHWHHARFDLSSGGTFDPFADDVRTFPVTIVEGEVWVNPSPPPRNEMSHWAERLREGMEHDIRLVISKSVLGLHASGADYRTPLTVGAEFGYTYAADGWGAGMSILTCMANILPQLAGEDRPIALYQGLTHLSRECAGKPSRFPIEPLPSKGNNTDVYKGWFRNFIDVRDAEGAERCLRTAIDAGLPQRDIADMVFAAATDHLYLDGGHTVDFANKAFDLLDHVGWDHSAHILTSLVQGVATARRSQELNSWRHPVDIASLVWGARDELPALWEEGRSHRGEWHNEEALAGVMMGDDPAGAVEAINEAMRAGASADALGSAVAYAAFLRMARFHTSNEFGDWDTLHNTLTAANGLHQALRRAPSAELLRGIFDTAMSIYLDRFLNMPPQPVPETGSGRWMVPSYCPRYWIIWTFSRGWKRWPVWCLPTSRGKAIRRGSLRSSATPCSGRMPGSIHSRLWTPDFGNTCRDRTPRQGGMSSSPWPDSWPPTPLLLEPRARPTRSPFDFTGARRSTGRASSLGGPGL